MCLGYEYDGIESNAVRLKKKIILEKICFLKKFDG
jgi:hypothetical protein